MVNLFIIRAILSIFVSQYLIPRIDWEQPRNIRILFYVHLGIQLLVVMVYLFVLFLVKKRKQNNDERVKLTEISFQDALAGLNAERIVYKTFKEYDTSQVFTSLRDVLLTNAFCAVFYFWKHSVTQVVMQIVFSPLSVFQNALVRIYFFKQQINRPFGGGFSDQFKQIQDQLQGFMNQIQELQQMQEGGNLQQQEEQVNANNEDIETIEAEENSVIKEKEKKKKKKKKKKSQKQVLQEGQQQDSTTNSLQQKNE